jgi:hypothetical protein
VLRALGMGGGQVHVYDASTVRVRIPTYPLPLTVIRTEERAVWCRTLRCRNPPPPAWYLARYILGIFSSCSALFSLPGLDFPEWLSRRGPREPAGGGSRVYAYIYITRVPGGKDARVRGMGSDFVLLDTHALCMIRGGGQWVDGWYIIHDHRTFPRGCPADKATRGNPTPAQTQRPIRAHEGVKNPGANTPSRYPPLPRLAHAASSAQSRSRPFFLPCRGRTEKKKEEKKKRNIDDLVEGDVHSKKKKCTPRF